VRVLPCGERAVLAEYPGLAAVLAAYAALRADPPAGVAEAVPGARTLLVHFDPTVITAERLAVALRRPGAGAAPAVAAGTLELPTVYRGEDLAGVAELTGLTPAEVVARHTGADYVVAFCGFAPGFGYLAGGDPALQVPRLATPRTRVPAGSVALADEYSGVYPGPSPGGWRLIGSTDVTLWDSAADPPALLVPGRRVRFRAVSP
jgi:KipI family sensor histidine kinase inhibitor